MALILCPECKHQISDKAEQCPYCGLPAKYFSSEVLEKSQEVFSKENFDYKGLGNVLISFDQDYMKLFTSDHYITHKETLQIENTYLHYYETLKNKQTYQYIEKHAYAFRIDIAALQSFLYRMHTLEADISSHNSDYVEQTLVREKEYFDNILNEIDPGIQLDDEQRRAVITDDDYCLLVAGAGAGKTTTMAAKVKYLVEKKHIAPEEIIVISYTNKAIGELKERINKGLGIPAKICTFHAFAFEIVKQFSAEPPEVNFSS